MTFLQTLIEVFQEACLDTLKAVPILFGVYILVSYFEHNSHKYINFFKKAEKFGPVVGSTIGIIPQCGFSVAMADLYNKKSISLGTLIAVFIATSDEAIPILFSNYDFILPMLMLILIKFVYAIFCGYVIDLILKAIHKKRQNKIVLASPVSSEPCECGHEGHNHEHTHHCCADNIFIDAIKHTLKITLFIFIVNFIMTSLVEFSGVNLSSLININKFAQPFVASFIGLIPNCVSSVLLVEVYMAGGMAFGSLIAGLCTNAGLGLLILFKNNKKNWAKNLLIVGLVYGLGVVLGLLINIF